MGNKERWGRGELEICRFVCVYILTNVFPYTILVYQNMSPGFSFCLVCPVSLTSLFPLFLDSFIWATRLFYWSLVPSLLSWSYFWCRPVSLPHSLSLSRARALSPSLSFFQSPSLFLSLLLPFSTCLLLFFVLFLSCCRIIAPLFSFLISLVLLLSCFIITLHTGISCIFLNALHTQDCIYPSFMYIHVYIHVLSSSVGSSSFITTIKSMPHPRLRSCCYHSSLAILCFLS